MIWLIGWIVVAVLVSLVLGKIIRGRPRDDEHEYLSKYSDANRARQDVPIMLRRQAD